MDTSDEEPVHAPERRALLGMISSQKNRAEQCSALRLRSGGAIHGFWTGIPLPALPLFALWLLLAFVARAHVGSQFVVFEGRAGSFPVRAVVRQPDVVPGLAEISVRVLSGQPEKVTALPIHFTTDRTGAPRPDVAKLVPGETNLYSAQLWFMTRGAYGVEVAVQGPGGGALIVPVNSIALEQKPMPPWLGWALSGLGLLLVAGLVSVAASAVRESTLKDTEEVLPERRKLAWLGGVIAVLVVAASLWGGAVWWRFEESNHQKRVLFHPLKHEVELANVRGQPALRLTIDDKRMENPRSALVPEHGRLMHQFLVAEGSGGAFAHLHPIKRKDWVFEAALPPLAAGNYRIFTDITHELGLTETLTNTIHLSASTAPDFEPTDDADSWIAESRFEAKSVSLGDGLTMDLNLEGFSRVGTPATLRASVKDAAGQPATLQPYLQMLGHAVVAKTDGTVFSHVHPAGTLSMTAARNFARKSGGEEAQRAADINCGDLAAVPPAVLEALSRGGEVSFPFVFPQAGEYQVWVQVRVKGKIRTGGMKVDLAGGSGRGASNQ